MKIIFSDNSLWGLLNFRGEIIRRFVARGDEVVLVAPRDRLSTGAAAEDIPRGSRHIDIVLSRTGANPLADLKYLRTLYKIYREEQPDYIFHYTIKPNIYGTLAAHWLGLRTTAMIAGVGHVFTKNNLRNRLARVMYRLAMRFPERVLVLNAANRDTLTGLRVVSPGKLLLLEGGEGVDLRRFAALPVPSNPRPVFLMICRLLYEKGYAQYVSTAEALRGRAEFRIMGPLDSHPAAVQRETLEGDIARGVIKWIAPSPDVEAQIALADCVVLPSFYGEGLSRVLMEGAAMARPLIASDIAGCREAVEDGVNGYLVEPRDTASLTAACSRFIALTPTKRKRMATASRRLAERLFDIDDVYKIYTDIMRFSYASSVRP